MIRSRLFTTLVAVAASLPSGPSALCAPAPRPNVLFIMTDQQFADAMSCCMGTQLLDTPAMDGLAASGMLFTRAYASNPLCMPLRNSLFTGRYPHETRVTKNAQPQRGLDPREFPCMGTYFRRAGFEAAYSGKWHLCFQRADPTAHGFEILRGNNSPGGPDVQAADAAVEFLTRQHDRPFLLVASFLNPHNICEWARRGAGRTQRLSCGEIGDPPPLEQLPPAPANLSPPENEPDGMTLMRRACQVENGPFPVASFTPDDWRKQRWGYYRMVELVDKEIGRVLDALRKSGQEENTVVVFTADHGECAGAHGFNQKTVFYEESTRVPLIVTWKGKTRRGTSDALVNIGVDILPTLLDVAGVEKPHELPGRSLWPLAVGDAVDAWRDYVVVQNNMSQTGVVDGFKPTLEGRMVRTDRYKYCIYSRGERRESLVDLQTDPGEMRDLATDPKYRPILLEHRKLLAEFGNRHKDLLVTELLADDVRPVPWEVDR